MASYQKKKSGAEEPIDPIWRGVGFIVLVVLTVGGFLLAQYLIGLNQQTHFLPFNTPTGFTLDVTKTLKLPGSIVLPVMFAVLLDIVGYALMVIIYALVNPKKKNPTDA